MYDLVFRHATVYDGSGAAPRVADLAVEQGRIAAIGPDLGAGRQEVNADSLALAPGIIDTHTHYDAQVTWDPYAHPSPALGVTTAVIGNCGFTIAPCRPADRDLVMRNLTHVEGMSLDALRSGIQWTFETFPEYLDHLDRKGTGPNIAAFVGHSSVRTYVMGEDASRRAATPAEVESMQQHVRKALEAGAVGFSSTTSYQHNGENGIPMPSRLAAESELRALVGVMSERDRGIFMLTRSVDTTIPFLESLAAGCRRPVFVAALLHNAVMPDAARDDLDAIGAAAGRGHRMYGAVSCCPLTFEFTMQSPYPFEGLSSWSPAMSAHGDAGMRVILADPAFRQSVKDEIARPVRRLFTGEWHKIHVLQVADPANAGHEGSSIADLAAATRKHPLDAMLDLALAENLGTVFTAALQNSDEDAVAELLRHPRSIVSLSDAGAHLTFFCDAGFGLHLLGHWVRDRRLMPLEQAVRKLTRDAAEVFGIRDRGTLTPGAWADLLLFDPATVGRGPAERLFDLPAGGTRLVTPSVGVHGVWVNGSRIADGSGIIPDAPRSGKVLRDFAS